MDIFISYRRTDSCLLTVAKIFAVKWRIVYLKEGSFFFRILDKVHLGDWHDAESLVAAFHRHNTCKHSLLSGN